VEGLFLDHSQDEQIERSAKELGGHELAACRVAGLTERYWGLNCQMSTIGPLRGIACG
jgi:hypothetical protein